MFSSRPLHCMLTALLFCITHQPCECIFGEDTVSYRQCRWSPFTANGMNNLEHTVAKLGSPHLNEFFKFDEEDDWEGIDDIANLKTTHLLPKWMFRNKGVMVLLAAALTVDKLQLDPTKGESELMLTAWNVLLCGVYKMYSNIKITNLVVVDVLGDNKMVPYLVDFIFRIGRCLQGDPTNENCPSVCNADNDRVKSCDSIPKTEAIKNNCQIEEDPDFYYEAFGEGAVLSELSQKAFNNELSRFLDWQSRIPEEYQIPEEIFQQNFASDEIVKTAATELIKIDPDETGRMQLDPFFQNLMKEFTSKGCDKGGSDVTRPKCIHFRAIFHAKLVLLQRRLIAKRSCKCELGYIWEPELQTCTKQLLGHCAAKNPCRNHGRCESKQSNMKKDDKNYVSIVAVCKCTPAWKGDHCELENNVCETLPRSSTCGQHICQRDPNFEIGFVCLCPPDFYRRISDTNPRCADINECENNPCMNAGECDNRDPGFICHCKHGYSGPRCEQPPESPFWGEWGEWGRCQIPARAFACSEFPKQIRSRECEATGIAQSCPGVATETRNICPGDISQWDLSHCGNQSKPSKNATENYAKLDLHPHAEELGDFAEDEIKLPTETGLLNYLNHFATLIATMLFGCFLVMLTLWCHRHCLRPMQRFIAKIIYKQIASCLMRVPVDQLSID